MLFKRKPDFERIALNQALSWVFSEEIKDNVLEHLEYKYKIKMNGREPLSKDQISVALVDFLGAGAVIVMSHFNAKLYELKKQTHTITH